MQCLEPCELNGLASPLAHTPGKLHPATAHESAGVRLLEADVPCIAGSSQSLTDHTSRMELALTPMPQKIGEKPLPPLTPHTQRGNVGHNKQKKRCRAHFEQKGTNGRINSR